MNKLEKALKQWVANGFINQTQADQIYQYESIQQHTSWVLSSLLVLGVLIIGLGVISIVAANWQQIPDLVKLISDFSILIFLSLVIVRSWSLKKEIQFEISLLFFMILCLASIGLIDQIYHTGGELYQALMFWSLITLPAATAARHTVIPFIWVGCFLASSAYTALASPMFQPIFDSNASAVSMAVPLFCACCALFGKYFTVKKNFITAFQVWFYMSGFIAIAIAEQYNVVLISKNGLLPYTLGYLLAALALLGVVFEREYHQIQKILLVIALACFLIEIHLAMFIKYPVIYAVFTLIILGLIAVFTASLQKRRLFQWILFFIGLRFLGLYFQALGGLAFTGIGLIISGLVIIMLTLLWYKYRNTISLMAERWVQ